MDGNPLSTASASENGNHVDIAARCIVVQRDKICGSKVYVGLRKSNRLQKRCV